MLDTYDQFEAAGAFTLLRPILITFLIISLLLFGLVVWKNAKRLLLNRFTVISISLISILVSAQVIYYSAIITDETGLAGDTVSTFLFLMIAGFGLLNPILYFSRVLRNGKDAPSAED